MLAAMGGPVTIGAATVTGMFDDPGQQVVRNGITVITDSPTLLLTEADAAGVVKNTTVLIVGGISYQAYEKTPDGAGFVELDLTRSF